MLLPISGQDNSERASVLADIERAIKLTRTGMHDEAREVYRLYRGGRSFGHDIEVSLMLMLLEGLIHYFADCDVDGAIDRLYRGRAIGLASKSDAGVAVLCSWLAHLYFNAGHHQKMAVSVEEAIRHGAAENAFAAERLFLTIADAHSLAGDFVGGRPYYDRARRFAISIGDSISIAAAAHNRSTLALSHARFCDAVGDPISPSVSSFLLELKSAEHLESYLELQNVLYPYSVWIARFEMLEGNFDHAEALLEGYLAEATFIPALLAPTIRADRAYCQFRCQRIESSLENIEGCLGSNLKGVASDDLAVLFSFSAQIFESVGDVGRRDMCMTHFSTHRDLFKTEIRDLAMSLAQLGSQVPLDPLS